MKLRIFIAIISAILLFSCGTSTPDNKTYASDSTLVGWDHAKAVYNHTVLIKPTWSQSFHYAMHAGWGLWLTVAIILFIVFGIFCYLIGTDNLPRLFENNLLRYLSLFVLLAGAGICFFGQPGSLKLNNDHWVPKQQYDHYMSTKGNITPVWDSLANNCHMNWGPDKGCKK